MALPGRVIARLRSRQVSGQVVNKNGTPKLRRGELHETGKTAA